MVPKSALLSNLLTVTKDGEWGKGEPFNDSVAMLVIRGTDFPSVRYGDLSNVPTRFIAGPIARRKHLQANDILIETAGGTKGQPTGRTVILKKRLFDEIKRPITCASFSRFLRVDAGRALPEYVYWYLQFLYQMGQMEEHQVQHTGVARFQYTKFANNARIPLPDMSQQRAIAHILGTLDDKIELNRRMNETLGAMGRAIFKSWFVDFDPVRAKMEGRWRKGESLPGLPAHLYDLFPNRLQDSEQSEIPEQWEVCALGELIELAYGKALKEENRSPGVVPVYGSNGQVGWHNEALALGPGIIVGRKGNPGIVTWVPTDFFAIDTTFYVVPKEKCRSLYFIFYALSGQDLPSLAADSAVPGLNRNFVYSNMQVVPSPDVLEAFERFVKASFDRQYQNHLESHALAAVRDALLPKLISGQIRVKDADQFVGRSV